MKIKNKIVVIITEISLFSLIVIFVYACYQLTTKQVISMSDFMLIFATIISGLMTFLGVLLTLTYTRLNNENNLSYEYKPILDLYQIDKYDRDNPDKVGYYDGIYLIQFGHSNILLDNKPFRNCGFALKFKNVGRGEAFLVSASISSNNDIDSFYCSKRIIIKNDDIECKDKLEENFDNKIIASNSTYTIRLKVNVNECLFCPKSFGIYNCKIKLKYLDFNKKNTYETTIPMEMAVAPGSFSSAVKIGKMNVLLTNYNSEINVLSEKM
jgi:hypothetical protein